MERVEVGSAPNGLRGDAGGATLAEPQSIQSSDREGRQQVSAAQYDQRGQESAQTTWGTAFAGLDWPRWRAVLGAMVLVGRDCRGGATLRSIRRTRLQMREAGHRLMPWLPHPRPAIGPRWWPGSPPLLHFVGAHPAGNRKAETGRAGMPRGQSRPPGMRKPGERQMKCATASMLPAMLSLTGCETAGPGNSAQAFCSRWLGRSTSTKPTRSQTRRLARSSD